MSCPSLPFGLIATDLDGTLLRSDDTVSERSRDALAAATAAGAKHLVVTGRPVSRTRHILDGLDYQGLAVCGQGAQVYHAGEHRLLTSVTLDRQVAQLAVAKLEAEVGPVRLAAAVDGLDGEILSEPGYNFAGRLSISTIPVRDAMWNAPLSKLYLQHPDLGDDELAATAHRIAGDLVGVTMAGEGIVEMLPLGLTKATGLSLAARRLGVRAEQAIAFGDMPNDLPMFAWASRGVAMANAHDALKAVADEITTSNDEDGIALVLERLLP